MKKGCGVPGCMCGWTPLQPSSAQRAGLLPVCPLDAVGRWVGRWEVFNLATFDVKEIPEGDRVAREDQVEASAQALGLERTASPAERKARLRRLAARHPPDANADLWIALRSHAEVFRHPLETLRCATRCRRELPPARPGTIGNAPDLPGTQSAGKAQTDPSEERNGAASTPPAGAKADRSLFLSWLG